MRKNPTKKWQKAERAAFKHHAASVLKLSAQARC